MRGLLRSHFVSAVLGGLVVAGGFLVFGIAGSKRTETIVEEAPVAALPASGSASGLTPNDIYLRDAPGVVFVRAKLVERVESPFNLFHARQSDTSTGSGFLVDSGGDILTDYHVIDGADRTHGVTVEFEDDTTRAAIVAAIAPDDDLAVLRVDMRGVPPVRPLSLGDSSSVRVGDPTLTIGNPFGIDRTLNSGIVAALQHEIKAADGRSIDNVIQTDQPLDAANSGAPLLDGDGRVIGINSQIATAGSDTTQRLAVAIPVDTADSLLARIDHGAPRLAYIGLSAVAGGKHHAGAVVGVVATGGPAAVAGLRAGDAVERVEGTSVNSITDILDVVSTRSPGQTLALQIRRGRRQRTLTVVLGSRTASPPQP
jgi:S1-C subfamily serine protease